MVNIYDYTDYKKYLRDKYQEIKLKNKHFSYQVFAEKANLRSKGFAYNLLNGKRNLTKSILIHVTKIFKLNKKEGVFLEIMMDYNHAGNPEEKSYFYEKLVSALPRQKGRQSQLMNKDQFKLHSEWYNIVIRSLIDMYSIRDRKNDYEWLANAVFPKIDAAKAKRAVKLLEKFGLIIKGRGGYYKVVDKKITTGKTVKNAAVLKYNLKMTELARNAGSSLPREKRHLSGMTLGISEISYNMICERINSLKDEISDIAENDPSPDKVFQMSFHLFPVSNPDLEQ